MWLELFLAFCSMVLSVVMEWLGLLPSEDDST